MSDELASARAAAVVAILTGDAAPDVDLERRNGHGVSLETVNEQRVRAGLKPFERAFPEAEFPGGARSAAMDRPRSIAGFEVID